MALLQGVEVDDLDGEKDREKGYKSLLSGPTPRSASSTPADEEREFLVETGQGTAQAQASPRRSVWWPGPTSCWRSDYQPMLKAAKVPCIVLEKKNEPGEPGVRLATMHRVKGLEFPVMILAGVNAERRAAAGVVGRGRPDRQGRTRGTGAVAPVRGGDQGQGSPDRDLVGDAQPVPHQARKGVMLEAQRTLCSWRWGTGSQ